MPFTDYHYHHKGTRREAEQYLDEQKRRGYDGRVTKVRDDLYEIKTWNPADRD